MIMAIKKREDVLLQFMLALSTNAACDSDHDILLRNMAYAVFRQAEALTDQYFEKV